MRSRTSSATEAVGCALFRDAVLLVHCGLLGGIARSGHLVQTQSVRIVATVALVVATLFLVGCSSSSDSAGSRDEVDEAVETLREAVARCVEVNYGPLARIYNDLPEDVQGVSDLAGWRQYTETSCEEAAIDGTLPTDGRLDADASLSLILEHPEISLPFCVQQGIAATRAQYGEFDRYLTKRSVERISRRTCEAYLSREILEERRAYYTQRLERGDDVSEVITALARGEGFDFAGFYRRSPGLIAPFFVAGEMRVYDEQFTAAEKEQYPRAAFRQLMSRIYRAAITGGLIDFDVEVPEISQEDFNELFARHYRQMRAAGQFP